MPAEGFQTLCTKGTNVKEFGVSDQSNKKGDLDQNVMLFGGLQHGKVWGAQA